MITGIKFPLSFQGGSVTNSSDRVHIEESIMQIIGTAKGEYLLKLDYGSRLSERIFDPINLAALVRIDINDAIRKYEHRVDLADVTVSVDNNNPGVVSILVGYTIKGQVEINQVSFLLGS